MSVMPSDDIRLLDPYSLLAALGKKVIRPGGRGSSEAIFRLADFQPAQQVLDIGCGVGTTAIQIASRFGCQVTAVDIDNRMIGFAESNIHKAGVTEKISLQQGDILALPYADSVFDVVTIEAVSMFIRDQQAAIREAVRVCKPGGYVFDHEFVWVRTPPADLRLEFDNIVCSGMSFETEHEWRDLFLYSGQHDIQVIPIPFDLLTFRGMLRDEGLSGTISFLARTLSRQAYISRMLWLIRVLNKVAPYLSSVVIACKKKDGGTNSFQSSHQF
ncbi:MAG: class I SAM-dependent methyltransferase [Gammaproteobacteria bacterium]|nr:class I SAM-dependent methyltransferase [Gammaproteobacteria bacterium]